MFHNVAAMLIQRVQADGRKIISFLFLKNIVQHSWPAQYMKANGYI